MSIQSEITLLQNTKDGLRTAIMEKGVTVYDSDLFSTYPTRISQISMTAGDKDSLFRSILERNVTELEIPDGVKYIAPYRFYGITTLTSLTIPATVDTIGYFAFNGCSSLESITINAVNPPYLSIFGDGQTTYLPFDDTNNCPIYVPAASVDAYKTAWSTYASRIQAIPQPQQQKFVRITDPADATSGYYLAAYSNAYALDASLVKSTTRSAGLNGETNTVNLSEHYDSHADEFLATADVLTHAFYFDAENGKMSWTDPDTDTTYYISYKSRGDKCFNYTNTTTVPTSTVTVGYVMEGYTDLTFKDGSYCLNATSETFQWIGIGACHIYKLTE